MVSLGRTLRHHYLGRGGVTSSCPWRSQPGRSVGGAARLVTWSLMRLCPALLLARAQSPTAYW